jgi:hypothetical protein
MLEGHVSVLEGLAERWEESGKELVRQASE